jgi:hypothetical protein
VNHSVLEEEDTTLDSLTEKFMMYFISFVICIYMYFMAFSISSILVKQSDLVVTLKTCISEVLGSNTGWGSCHPQVFYGFPQSLQTNG